MATREIEISCLCYFTHLRVKTLIRHLGNFSYKTDLFVAISPAQINVGPVIDTEQKRRARFTCQRFDFKMLITVTWCKATRVTLERIAFL